MTGDRMPNFWRLRSLQSPARTWARFWGVRVPLRRLKFLLLGVFCLAGMVGCLLDAVVLGSKPFVEVIAWIVFTGIMAVVYLVLALRVPRWLIAGILLHIAGSIFVRLCFII